MALEGNVVIGFCQFGADGQHHIRGFDQLTCRIKRLRGADQQRMTGPQHAFGIDGQGNRGLQQLGNLPQG